MTKPICYIDCEATGVDPATDRIVGLSMLIDSGLEASSRRHSWLINPEREMSPEVIAIHGITNEQVAGVPPFRTYALAIHHAIAGCDLAGYNLLNYDVPILWEEFYRCGITWNLDGVHIIDAGNIFKKKEERTLSAAVKFYCGREHADAHNSMGDVLATRDVLLAQVVRYDDLKAMDRSALSKWSAFDDRVDLAGKIVRGPDGDPVYNIGKAKGRKVKDDVGFGCWMLDRDFTQNTKAVLRGILEEAE